MKRHCAPLFCCLIVFTASSAAFAQVPSTTATDSPARTHQLKLGLRSTYYDGLLPSAAYEWQVAPQLSIEAGGSFLMGSSKSGWDYVDWSGNISRNRYTRSHLSAAVFGQARYYLQASKAPLTGWYLGLGLQANYSYHRTTYTEGGTGSTQYARFLVQPQLRIGRQWALGQRLSLDTYLGLDYVPNNNGNGIGGRLRPATGVQLGYRF